MNLGATELFHSVTPTGSGYIYTRAKIWKFLQTLHPRLSSSADSWSPDCPLVTSNLLSLVSAAVNWNLRRRCRCSEFIAKLGYELEPLCNL